MSNGSAGYRGRFLGAGERRLPRPYLERFEPELLAAAPECGPLTQVAHYLIKAGSAKSWARRTSCGTMSWMGSTTSVLAGLRTKPAAHVKFGTAQALPGTVSLTLPAPHRWYVLAGLPFGVVGEPLYCLIKRKQNTPRAGRRARKRRARREPWSASAFAR